MSSYFPKLNQESFVISSKNPKDQKKYLKYYHSENEEMLIVLRLDRVLIMKSKDRSYLKDFFFITRANKNEDI